MLVPNADRLTDFGHGAEAVERARNAASRQLREAINARYLCPLTLDEFPTTPEGDELRALVELHGVALAALALSQHDGGRSPKTEAEARTARGWLEDVKAGRVDLGNVLQRRTSGSNPNRQVVVIGTEPEILETFWDAGKYSPW